MRPNYIVAHDVTSNASARSVDKSCEQYLPTVPKTQRAKSTKVNQLTVRCLTEKKDRVLLLAKSHGHSFIYEAHVTAKLDLGAFAGFKLPAGLLRGYVQYWEVGKFLDQLMPVGVILAQDHFQSMRLSLRECVDAFDTCSCKFPNRHVTNSGYLLELIDGIVPNTSGQTSS